MLAVRHRLRHRDEFAATVKRGRRAGRGCLVVHVLASAQPPSDDSSVVDASGNGASDTGVALDGAAVGVDHLRPVRVGFVVPRSVGNAVARNQVRRRLRHLMRDRLTAVPAGTDVVVRVAPGATDRSYAQLAADLDGAIAAAVTGARSNSRGRKARSSA